MFWNSNNDFIKKKTGRSMDIRQLAFRKYLQNCQSFVQWKNDVLVPIFQENRKI